MALSAAYDIVAVNIGYQDYIVNFNNGFCKKLHNNELDVTGNVKKNYECNSSSGDDLHTILVRYCSALSPCGKWYASVLPNKKLSLRETNNWSLVSERKIERSPSKLIFTPSCKSIILTDKTGDVYAYSVLDPLENGVLLLGHVSVLLDLLVTPEEKYIITCDRDEKIRVSHYPNTYNIKSFCLGHTEYVIRITLLNDILISASGDGTIRLWNYECGKELLTYFISNDIEVNSRQNEQDRKYAIKDMSSIYKTDSGSFFCILVNNYTAAIIYKLVNDPLTITHVQEINLITEPISVLLNKTGLLLILTPSETNESAPFVKVMAWETDQFSINVDRNVINNINLLNASFETTKLNNMQIDLGGLYKNSKISPNKFKRIKK